MLSLGLCMFLLFTLFSSAQAQQRVSSATITNFTATWVDIATTGTLANYVIAAGGDPYQNNDEAEITIPLPFDFLYDGVLLPAGSNVGLCTNHSVEFGGPFAWNGGNVGPWFGNSPCEGKPTSPGIIVFGSQDGYTVTGSDHYQVDGSAPNRVLTFQQNSSSPPTIFQVKLYEGSGTIELIYHDHTGSLNGGI